MTKPASMPHVQSTFRLLIYGFLQKLMKVKATDKFCFPLSIDFAPYQSSNNDDKQAASQLYDLQAILIHKGSSASQGHYGELLLSPKVLHSVYLLGRRQLLKLTAIIY